jgi:hypothetical protein
MYLFPNSHKEALQAAHTSPIFTQPMLQRQMHVALPFSSVPNPTRAAFSETSHIETHPSDLPWQRFGDIRHGGPHPSAHSGLHIPIGQADVLQGEHITAIALSEFAALLSLLLLPLSKRGEDVG